MTCFMANHTVDLDKALAVAIELALQAGGQLLARARERATPFSDTQLAIVQKANAVDLVTEADEDAEKIIRDGLKKNFPGHAFVGEESYGKDALNNEYLVGDEPTWVVDPLDGTVSNFRGGDSAYLLNGFILRSTTSTFSRQCV